MESEKHAVSPLPLNLPALRTRGHYTFRIVIRSRWPAKFSTYFRIFHRPRFSVNLGLNTFFWKPCYFCRLLSCFTYFKTLVTNLTLISFYASFWTTVHHANSKNKCLLLDPCNLIFRSIVSVFVCTLPAQKQYWEGKHLLSKSLGCTVHWKSVNVSETNFSLNKSTAAVNCNHVKNENGTCDIHLITCV